MQTQLFDQMPTSDELAEQASPNNTRNAHTPWVSKALVRVVVHLAAMKVHHVVGLLLLVSRLSFTFGLSENDKVTDKSENDKVTDKSQEFSIEDIYQDKHMTILKVYSTMCGTCKMFQPEWLKLKNHINGKFRIVEVDIDKTAGLEFAGSIRVLDEGVPNVRLYFGDAGKYFTMLHGAVGFADELYPKIIARAKEEGYLDSTGVYAKGSPPQPFQNLRNIVMLVLFSVVMLCLVLSYGMPSKQRRTL